jgi:hypothetical protein
MVQRTPLRESATAQGRGLDLDGRSRGGSSMHKHLRSAARIPCGAGDRVIERGVLLAM